MSNMVADTNRRVLVIDDNAAIHDDFRKILCPRSAAALDATEAAVFGQVQDAVRQPRFEVDSAYQGPEGLLMVTKHLEAKRPYAMAFPATFVAVTARIGPCAFFLRRFFAKNSHRLARLRACEQAIRARDCLTRNYESRCADKQTPGDVRGDEIPDRVFDYPGRHFQNLRWLGGSGVSWRN
jgi:hypothetical protein